MVALSPGDCRQFFLLCRSLAENCAQQPEHLRAMRRYMDWTKPEPFADYLNKMIQLMPEYHDEFVRAFSTGQIESKLWLLDALRTYLIPKQSYRFLVVGGWVGVLPRLITWLIPEYANCVFDLEIDARAQEASLHLNRDSWLEKIYRPLNQNALLFDPTQAAPHVYINCSTEHFTPSQVDDWMDSIPAGRLVCLQSNNLYDEPDHINCYPDVYKFRNSLSLRTLLYHNEIDLGAYKRFMVIGISKGPRH